MGNACVAREDSPEVDRRAYEAHLRLWTEVRATLHDPTRLQNECSQSFRMACDERGVQHLTKPLLQEMTNHFIRRLSCDNPRMVQSIYQHLDEMCPQNLPINQAQFTEFTRSVLTHIERDLRDKLEKLQRKCGGRFPPYDGQGGSASQGDPWPSCTADARPRGDHSANAGRPPDTISAVPLGSPPSEEYPQGDRRPPVVSMPSAERRCTAGEEQRPTAQRQIPKQPQPPVVYAAPPEPVKLQPTAPMQQPLQTQTPKPAPFTPSSASGAHQSALDGSRSTLDLLPGTGNLSESSKGQSGFDSSGGVGQQPTVKLVSQTNVEISRTVTFGNDSPPPRTNAILTPQANVPGGTPTDPSAPLEKGLPEYHAESLEDMKKEILNGNLRVQVYNQHFVLEVKRLAVNAHMQIIAIFGDDGRAVASFEIKDLQCVTQGIATTIMDPAPPPDRSVAFRFKDRFLCVVFDRPDICFLAVQAFSQLCDVPVEKAESV